MRRLLALLLLAGGCFFAPKFENGKTPCKSDHDCPSSFQCAEDQHCWKPGTAPVLDLSVPLDGMAAELFAPGDLGGGDFTVPPDLTPVAKKHQGQACGAGDICDTGNCVDGYCCDTPCANTCQACNITGLLGVCSDVASGGDPVGSRTCNAQAANTCGRDGKCDGQGNCRFWPSGTNCSTGSCDTGTDVFTPPSTCSGTGTCVSNGTIGCTPYKCQDTTQCWASCTAPDNSHCSGTNTCAGGSCGLLPDGNKCTTGGQCLNGNCVDTYCCNSSCANACQACDVAGNHGVCTTVPDSTPHGTRMCNHPDGAPCAGTCDGNIATCSYKDNTTLCKVTCASATQVQKSFCDHNGSCVDATPGACTGNFICSGSACLSSCSVNGDCDPGYACSSGACKLICTFDTDTFDDGCVFGL